MHENESLVINESLDYGFLCWKTENNAWITEWNRKLLKIQQRISLVSILHFYIPFDWIFISITFVIVIHLYFFVFSIVFLCYRNCLKSFSSIVHLLYTYNIYLLSWYQNVKTLTFFHFFLSSSKSQNWLNKGSSERCEAV